MLYHEALPHPKLARFVKLFWSLEGGPSQGVPRQRIVPDGIVELAVHFAAPFVTRSGGVSAQIQPISFLNSQTSHFIDIEPTGEVGFVAARFYPWGAHHFIGVPVREFADRTIPAREVWGAGAAELEQRIASSRDRQHRIEIMQAFLVRKLERHHKHEVDPLVRFVWKQRGQCSVARMAQDLGVTERRLERLFGMAIGTGPKRFARITRFLHSCAELRRGRNRTLTEVAYRCGYYDQAHFIIEFRDFAGVTPSGFVADPSISALAIQ